MSVRRLLLLAALACAAVPPAAAQETGFARLVARLSEPGGYFDSDNLVSNETSYLHVLGGLRDLGVRGGAYVGVGPEQGFSYIAEIRPAVAVIIDIRRDNLLLHLLLKAMFESARNRAEYLGMLYGRPAPERAGDWTGRPLDSLIAWLDRTPADSGVHARTHLQLMRRVERYGVPLSDTDRATMRRFHDEFAAAGLDLRYRSSNRSGRRNYPTVRRLYLEGDRDGGRGSYLASEERWRVVRDLQRRDRVVPVVGDLAGPHAMRAIGAWLRESDLTLSVFYASNVEQYLFRYGTFDAFAANMRSLPTGPTSVIIRSWFDRGWMSPNALPGHFSAQLLQTLPRFLALTAQPGALDYWALVNDGAEVPAGVP